ncbi:sulfatase-like hydrolase/transferase [Algibacter amylolyticus]|uniref:Sulfatase-like hydrolase/transferase n=1 Tax=Algibacter amylolyticus TaxID=1608400 RepID=A0A5M7B684_9FLAO|nr:sulfatase [Algibacter amylolyticus]KAA5824829.1 sulfatase-like hydrolase/transferase [Algibacter amylolyticus]MBB5268955.1 arylsulfatase A-like enzyme [Algibacter amylolyticus]TSJ75994.1 sulfatase-like hydrolase/transferase [Algibacter amylolyticus]
MRILTLAFLTCICLTGCQTKKADSTSYKQESSGLSFPERPNILWLVTEDMGAYIPPFGDLTVETPNLTRLANEGVVYPNLYSTSGVCAPSRAAIATGMYPSSIGANHMRTNSYTQVTGLPAYEAVPPPSVKMVSELLRMNGYYCSNNYKEDYQFKAPVTAWDESSYYAHWRNRAENQPFFSVINFTETHESGLFEPYGFRNVETRHYHEGDTTYVWKQNGLPDSKNRIPESEITKHLPKDTKFNIPPYLPDTPKVRNDMWKLYNNIAEMDKQVGAVLKQLENDGLLDNTIVFFYGDHGGPLPREKRLIYDSGLNTPMIIRFPKKQKAKTKDNQLVSFIDFAPTLLSLIDVEPPKYMQGQAFLGNYKAKKERKYIHAAADRFDEVTDVIRAVRDNQFKYIRNYRPEQGYYLPLSYREKIPSMQELLRLKDEVKLNDVQKQWFRERKPEEELFDCIADPFELNNLAAYPEYKEKLQELRNEMDNWLQNIGDHPNLPEAELIDKLWGGLEKQPITANPTLKHANKKLVINCDTEGASIGYKIKNDNGKFPKYWSIYTEPIFIQKDKDLLVKAHRIGFKSSKTVQINTSNLK